MMQAEITKMKIEEKNDVSKIKDGSTCVKERNQDEADMIFVSIGNQWKLEIIKAKETELEN